MKILEIYIDGYKNIKNTRLSFSESIVVLLSKNNYGKSNVIEGVSFGFKFLGLSRANAYECITAGKYFNKFKEDDDRRFTFEVKFQKEDEDNKTYLYSYAFGETKNGDYGILDEELSCEENGYTWVLLKRNSEKPTHVMLRPKDPTLEPGYFYLESDIPADGAGLFIHMFGQPPIQTEGKTKWELRFDKILEEIHKVYIALPQAGVGEIIFGESADLNNLPRLFKDLHTLKHNDEDGYAFFIESFKKMFPEYESVTLEMNLAKEPYLVLRGAGRDKSETIETLSTGTKKILKLLGELYFSETPLISVEELENGIHPKLLDDVLNIFQEISERKRRSESRFKYPRLIITSHSVNLINLFSEYLDSLHVGLDGFNRDKDMSARFVAFSEKGKQELMDEFDLLGIWAAGRLIYDYGEDEEYSTKLRRWLED